VKEKVLAAHRAGIKTIVLPERNRVDLEEVPKSALTGAQPVKFHFVKEMSEVVELSLLSEEETRNALAGKFELDALSVN
jgi:ATP-dependent Lon protease